MNDVIKQIEEVKEYFDQIMFSPNSTEADFIKAALTVLQKMAGGDDWFEFKELKPPIREKVLITDGVNVGHAYFRGSVFVIVASNDVVYLKDAPKWKHIDQSKHIEKLMKEAMKDD